jgi:hypothetical protein
MGLEMTAPPVGLLKFSADQWSSLHSLASAVVEQRDAEDVQALLRESSRLGVLPEANLVADVISDEAYSAAVAGRLR